MELNAQPMRGLNTYINLGFQDAKYVDIAPTIRNQQAKCRASIAAGATARPRCVQGRVNAAGEISAPIRAPKVSISASVSYTGPTGWSNVGATGALNLSYQSPAAESAFSAAHTVINASIGLLGGEVWKRTADCSNCSNKKSFTASLAGLNYLNDSRRYSVKLNYTFK